MEKLLLFFNSSEEINRRAFCHGNDDDDDLDDGDDDDLNHDQGNQKICLWSRRHKAKVLSIFPSCYHQVRRLKNMLLPRKMGRNVKQRFSFIIFKRIVFQKKDRDTYKEHKKCMSATCF